MTDAREIIARHLCTMAAQGWSGISAFERAAYRTTAAGMVQAITSAGCRILGPGEWDKEADWQPIETAPKDGSRVICWNAKWGAPESGCRYGTKWAANSLAADRGGWKYQPTHWRPLPAPPAIRALAKEKQG